VSPPSATHAVRRPRAEAGATVRLARGPRRGGAPSRSARVRAVLRRLVVTQASTSPTSGACGGEADVIGGTAAPTTSRYTAPSLHVVLTDTSVPRTRTATTGVRRRWHGGRLVLAKVNADSHEQIAERRGACAGLNPGRQSSRPSPVVSRLSALRSQAARACRRRWPHADARGHGVRRRLRGGVAAGAEIVAPLPLRTQ